MIRHNQVLVLLVALILLSCRPAPHRPAGICLSFDVRSVREWYALDTLFQRYGAVATFFVTQGELLLLHGHAPCRPESGQEYCFDIPALEAILETANELGIRFYTVNQLAG